MTPAESSGPARRLAIAGAVGEIVAARAMERRLGGLADPTAKTSRACSAGAATALTAAGAALLAAGRGRRGRTLAGAGLILGGAICERWSIFTAGFASAEDPKYTVGPQRARIDAAG